MAHYRCHVKPGRKGRGAEHAQYIERGGRFSAEDYGEIGEHARGNLPAWAKGSAARFFAAADEHERANGNSYREFELALPRELSDAERGQLVRDFVAEQIGDRHAYAWAIHEPKGHNPHAHIMFSERLLDGIERSREQYFKRANTQQPERGGQLKSDRFAGRGGREAVLALRERWAELQNQALERAGHKTRVDHRSLKAQGIEREPGQHRGPAVSAIEARGEVAQVSVRRAAERVAQAQARAAVASEVRVVSRAEVAAERVAVRERRELAREVKGEDRALVLPLVEADRREQLGRAQAAAERRVERRQGLSIGGEFKEKLLTQARALRERIGRELGRVKAWVAERFPEPLERLKERAREVVQAVARKARGAEQAPERSAGERTPPPPAPTLEEQRAAGRAQWLAMREQAREAAPPAEAQGASRSPARSLEEQQREGREKWLNLRAEQEAVRAAGQRQASGRAAPAEALSKEERERLNQMTAAALRAEIARVRPAPVGELVERDPSVQGLVLEARELKAVIEAERRRAAQAAREAEQFRAAHPTQAALHERGVFQSKALGEIERRQIEAAYGAQSAGEEVRRLGASLAERRQDLAARISQETAPARVRVAALEQIAGERAQRERLVGEFYALAKARVLQPEASLKSEAWQAAPARLRDTVERFNRQRPPVQAEILQAAVQGREPLQKMTQILAQDLQVQREQIRQREIAREHGLDGPER
jgi:hypothetical protein